MKHSKFFITMVFSLTLLTGVLLTGETWAQSNDILGFRVISKTSNQIVMDVSYVYAGNFGSNVAIGAKMANNGKPSKYYAYKPGSVSKGRHTTRVTLRSNASARFTTNQILLFMYIGSKYPFVEKLFSYSKTWSEPVKRPDLIISRINFLPGKPTVNDKITFWVFVKNIGRGPSGPSKLRVKVGGESNPPVISVPALNPGQEYRHTRRVRLTVAQNYLVTAIADARNNLRELNEKNNTSTKRFRVTK